MSGVQTYPTLWRPDTSITDQSGKPTQFGQYLLLQLYNRTGAGTGIVSTVGSPLVASGNSQQTALQLINDLNEITGGSGGVSLYPLKPGQQQWVFNASGGTINVYPPSAGEIDALGLNIAYSLNNNKTQIFTCLDLLTSGGSFFRSLQLG